MSGGVIEIAPLRRMARGSCKVRHADCNQVALEAYLSFSQHKFSGPCQGNQKLDVITNHSVIG